MESTETWCIAAFNRHAGVEELEKNELIVPFMTAIHRSEGRDIPAEISKIDKSLERRKVFCKANASNYARVASQCASFSLALTELESIAPDFAN